MVVSTRKIDILREHTVNHLALLKEEKAEPARPHCEYTPTAPHLSAAERN